MRHITTVRVLGTASAAALLCCNSSVTANHPNNNPNNANHAPQCTATDDNGDCIATNDNDNTTGNQQCLLHLAPSSLPHAGLGLFAGSTHALDTSLNSNSIDKVLPILDKYKALPYRGQQRFPSYLAYMWTEHKGALAEFSLDEADGPRSAFPTVPSELWDVNIGLDGADGMEFYKSDAASGNNLDPRVINAFVPGFATLANHHEELNNIDRVYLEDYGDEDDASDYNHAGIEYFATTDVTEGMELLLNYGEEWAENNYDQMDWIEKKNKRKAAANDDNIYDRKGHVQGIDTKWDQLVKRELRNVANEIPTEKAKREREVLGFSADSSQVEASGKRPFSEYRANNVKHNRRNDWVDDDNIDWDKYPTTEKDITKPLKWLNQNGICLDSGNLIVKPSNMPQAGQGVHATKLISKGTIILPSPLIAMRKEDFLIYKSDPTQEFARKVLDKTSILGKEMLYNYAFSHPDSPLYLVPTAPLANFINHGGGINKGSSIANVQIRWPEKGSNTAKLFEWAYGQKIGSHFDNDFDETSIHDNPTNPWLEDHPIDVMERSGKLALEYVSLRDIQEGEEILIDYGELWNQAWGEFNDNKRSSSSNGGDEFRHSIGVPEGFFPDNWRNVGDQYEVAELQEPLQVGVAVPMTWAHNGKPVGSKYAYVIGLEKGFSERFLEYSEKNGVVELYRKLLTEQEGYHLPSDGFKVYNTPTLVNSTSISEAERAVEFFAHRYATATWNLKFNMHYVSAWNELARRSVLAALGDAGFDLALKGIGERFGYDNMTCFHTSYMGLTHCEKSIMHSDIYATNDKSWNMVHPLVTVEGTDPELDVMAEDMNTVIGVHYRKDVIYAMGDYGYHQTRPMAYYNPEDEDSKNYGDSATNGAPPIRVVFGMYCSQIDETNIATIRHIYDGDDPAPFADQFVEVPMREIHWDKATGTSSLAKPGGKGY